MFLIKDSFVATSVNMTEGLEDIMDECMELGHNNMPITII